MRPLIKKGAFVFWRNRIHLVTVGEDDCSSDIMLDSGCSEAESFLVSSSEVTVIRENRFLKILEKLSGCGCETNSAHLETLKFMRDKMDEAAKDVSLSIEKMDQYRKEHKDDKVLSGIINPDIKRIENAMMIHSRELRVAREAYHNAVMRSLGELILTGGL
jgi:hypothetical protein